MFGKLIPKQNPDEERNTAKRTRRKRWYKVVCSMAAVVVVCTVYTLMLPALTLDQDSAADAGVTVEQSHDTSSSADTESGTGDKTADSTAAESSESSSSSESSESADNGDSAVTDGTPSDTGSDAGDSTSGADSDTPSDTDGTGSDSSKSDADSTGTDDPADTGSTDSGTAAKADVGDSSKSSDSSSDASLSGDEPVSDDTADVETASDWEATFSELLGSDEWPDMTWGEKLAAMAATQLGYTESTKNFRVSSDGDLKGYTRYGDWYGNAYGDWCAMFVSFCLSYSDIDSDIVPQNANCASWIGEIEETGLYFTADTEYVPEVGDVVFFDRTGSGKSDHVGIISDVELGEKEVTKHFTSDGTAVEDSAIALVSYIKSGLSSLLSSSAAQTADLADTDTGIDSDMSVDTNTTDTTQDALTEETVTVNVAEKLTVIEGNSSDRVQEVEYDLTDESDAAKVLGYISMSMAEYVYNGGELPDDLDNMDQVETLAIGNQSTATVMVGETITLTGSTNSSFTSSSYHEWSVSDTTYATVTEGSGNSAYTATITGKKAKVSGETKLTLTHRYVSKRTWGWIGYNETWTTETLTLYVADQASEDNAQIYYLISPTESPRSNHSDIYGGNMGSGRINLTGAVWADGDDKALETNTGKNVYSGDVKVRERMLKWSTWAENTANSTQGTHKNGKYTGTLNDKGIFILDKDTTSYTKGDGPRGETIPSRWLDIYNSYRSEIQRDLGISITTDDVGTIEIVPYKISRNNGTTPDKHVDCTIKVNCEKAVTAVYYLWDVDSTGFIWEAAKNYEANAGQTTSYKDFDAIKDLPAYKLNQTTGVLYQLKWWYDNDDLTGDSVTFPYEMKDKNVDFYGKYMPVEAGVKYSVTNPETGQNMGGTIGFGEETPGNTSDIDETLVANGINLSEEKAEGATPTPADGYTFDGWYTYNASDKTWTKVSNGLVDSNGRIRPQWSSVTVEVYTQNENGSLTYLRDMTYNTWENIAGTTYYARFTAGIKLPETGGPGTTSLYILGGALALSAGTLLVYIKRKQKRGETG